MNEVAWLQLRYLEAEFARLDVLLRREVRKWVLAGQDPNDDYRGMYIAQAEAEALLDRPFGVSWGQWVALPTEEAELQRSLAESAVEEVEAWEQALQENGVRPRVLQLAEAFHLDRRALDILLLCIAPAFDTKYERLYGYLQDNVTRRRPSVRLILDLLGDGGIEKFSLAPYLHGKAPLFQHRLLSHVIEPPPVNGHWLNQTLQPSETVVAWLRGDYATEGALTEEATFTEVTPDATDTLLASATVERLRSSFQTDSVRPILSFVGADQLKQQAVVRLLAATAGISLLTVTLKKANPEERLPGVVLPLALRDARITGALLHLCGWESVVDADGGVEAALMAQLCAHPGLVVLSSSGAWQPGGLFRTRRILVEEFALPGYVERQELWRHFIDLQSEENAHGKRNATTIAKRDLELLAGQFELTSATIRDVVTAARDQADQTQSELTADLLFSLARRYSNPRLSTLARKIEPRYAWTDIILPVDQKQILQELVATVRHRPKVLHEWGVGNKLAASAGVTVLFAGPPGTGKTMAAEVIAGELRLDLYKIDLASVVSKYIGETEKNLEKIFTEAASSNAILFFDEADAIFGKRAEVKDAHDRYANVEISYLLQRMEAYDGVTILATNLRGNLDEAFLRRIHFAVDFPFPRMADRLRIWQALFPPELPRTAELDLAFFAREFELAGGNIRNIIVSAAYLAADNGQVVTHEHLLHGARRELRKMGRLVQEHGRGNLEYGKAETVSPKTNDSATQTTAR